MWILFRENVTLEELNALQGQVESLIVGNYKVESENSIRDAEVNDKQIQGMMAMWRHLPLQGARF